MFLLRFFSVDSNDDRKSALKPISKILNDDDDVVSCAESDLDPDSDGSTKKNKKSTRANTSSKNADVKRVS